MISLDRLVFKAILRYHAAFVYEFSSSTQKIFLNGILDGNQAAAAYRGTSESITIGRTDEYVEGSCYFNGNAILSNRVSL